MAERLTLDDLLEMDGEPVWLIAYDESRAIHQLEMWVLVEVTEDGEIYLINNLGGRDNVTDIEFNYVLYRSKPEEA